MALDLLVSGPMHRFPILALCAGLLLAPRAFAAEVTNVADAMDERHPLEVDLAVSGTHQRRETRITREQATAGGILIVDELHHLRTVDELGFRLGVGLWHDLELHVSAPLVLRDSQELRYADVNGVSVEGVSTLKNNHLDVSGCGGPGRCAQSGPASPIVAPGESRRSGFRDPTVGIAWGPINEERELRLRPELYPEGHPVSTWVIGFDYTLPLVPQDDPSRFGAALPTGVSPGAEGRKAHVFTLWTAFSKRYRVLEPYFRFSGSVPLATNSSYDNCAHPELLSDVGTANCAGSWKGQTAYHPAPQGGFELGAELVAAEDRKADERLSFDVRAGASYHGPGRDYTQVTDALGKLQATDDFLAAQGSLGVYGRLARFFHAKLEATLGFETAHYLTHEDIGADKSGDGKISISAGSGRPAPDQNPNYDFRLDQIGRRLRAEPSLLWGVSGTLSLDF